MTAKQFFDKYNGKPVRFNGSSNSTPQCTDLAAQYNTEVVGAPNVSDGNGAKDWYANASRSFYTPIANTPSFVPKRGDIAVWNEKLGNSYYENGIKYTPGHVAICEGEGDTNYFVSFDQNWGGQYAHYVRHSYLPDGVVNFLRPKKDVNFDVDAYNAEQAKIAEANRVAAETAQKIADEAQKAEAKRVADEQKKLAEEAAKLEAERLAKIEADRLEKEKADQLAQEAINVAQNEAVKPTEPIKGDVMDLEKTNGIIQSIIDFMDGKKTYTGLLLVLFGSIQLPQWLCGVLEQGKCAEQAVSTISLAVILFGLVFAAYGRWKAKK